MTVLTGSFTATQVWQDISLTEKNLIQEIKDLKTESNQYAFYNLATLVLTGLGMIFIGRIKPFNMTRFIQLAGFAVVMGNLVY